MKNQIDKTKILLDSFDVLKDDWDNNKTDILKIFDIIFKENVSTALEMWNFLLNRYSNESNPDPYLVSGILLSYIKNASFESKQINILRKHNNIVEKIFVKSIFIKDDYRIYATFLEQLIVNNKNKDFGYFLDIILNNHSQQVPKEQGYFWKAYFYNHPDKILKSITGEYYFSADARELSLESPSAPLSIIILLEILSFLEEKSFSLQKSSTNEIQNIIYSYIDREANPTYRAKLNVAFMKLLSSINNDTNN